MYTLIVTEQDGYSYTITNLTVEQAAAKYKDIAYSAEALGETVSIEVVAP